VRALVLLAEEKTLHDESNKDDGDETAECLEKLPDDDGEPKSDRVEDPTKTIRRMDHEPRRNRLIEDSEHSEDRDTSDDDSVHLGSPEYAICYYAYKKYQCQYVTRYKKIAAIEVTAAIGFE